MTSRDFSATFSFLNYVFWKDDPSLNPENLEKIRQHELIHIRQKHSYDVIYIRRTNLPNNVIQFREWPFVIYVGGVEQYLRSNLFLGISEKQTFCQK